MLKLQWAIHNHKKQTNNNLVLHDIRHRILLQDLALWFLFCVICVERYHIYNNMEASFQ